MGSVLEDNRIRDTEIGRHEEKAEVNQRKYRASMVYGTNAYYLF